MRIGKRFLDRSGLVATVVAAGLLLGACQTTGPNQTAGTLLGAAAGGFMGSRIGGGSGRLAATALGTIVGAGIGSNVGAGLDRSQAYAPAYPRTRTRIVEHHHYYEDDRWHPRRHRHRHWHR